MRVAFLTHNFPRFAGDPSGSFLLRLAVALRDVDVEVRVWAPAAPGHPAVDAIEGVPVERFRYAPRALETIAYTGTMASAVRGSWGARAALGGMIAAAAAAGRRAVRSWRADVVHAHWWFPAGLAATLPGAGRAPVLLTMHGSDVRLAAGIAPARTLFRRVARGSSAVTAVSRWLCEQATAMAPGLACNVAPMPAATEVFSGPGTVERRGLLFVGRLNAQKGLAHLLRALAAQRAPTPLTVLGDGPDASALHALAHALGVADRVTWRPESLAQRELAVLYQGARAVVMPSVGEGLGLVAVEAMLCETPVVAFASGGLVDVVEPDRTGWLVPPGDVAALADALDAVVAAGDLASVGAAARKAMLARFSPAVVAAGYRALYEGALAGREALAP